MSIREYPSGATYSEYSIEILGKWRHDKMSYPHAKMTYHDILSWLRS